MNILVVAEHDGAGVLPASHGAVAAAAQLGGQVSVLVIGHACQGAAEAAAAMAGVAAVRCIDAPHYADSLSENLAMPIAQMAGSYSHIVFAASPWGKSLAPRVAAMLDVAPVTDITAVCAPDTFVRPTYAGNVLTTIRSAEPVQVLSVRTSAFAGLGLRSGEAAPISSAPKGPDMGVARLCQRLMHDDVRPALASARVVVAGGRGLGSAEAFARWLYPLADCLGAALGATRAAVDAGFAPHDWQVGQTGKIVAPDLYIAVGISGAAQHLAGMRQAKTIVAINSDPEAPIFQFADYRLVGPVDTILPELLGSLQG